MIGDGELTTENMLDCALDVVTELTDE